jgi:outer membrane receptor protein involved in Fe transport
MAPVVLRAQASGTGVRVDGVVRLADGPVANVSVAVAEVERVAVTDADGHFVLRGLQPGRYHLTARRRGLQAAALTVDLGTRDTTVTIVLEAAATRIEPVTVTASRSALNAAASPRATSALEGDAMHQGGGISLAHAIQGLPGLRVVSTGAQIGKPMIRGLSGARTLVLANGFRLEDYSWSDEDGPSIDVRLGQRVEVVRGPASVLYGSDALGGVVNVVPEALPIATGSNSHRDGIEVYGAGNGVETGGVLQREGTHGAYGYRIMGTGRFAMNYRTPAGEQPNSGYWAFNGDAAVGHALWGGLATLRLSHYGGEFHLLEATGPETGDPEGGPVRQVLDDRLQFTHLRPVGRMRLETRAQVQRHALAEVSDDCQPLPGQTTCTKVKDQQAFGLTLTTGSLDVLAHHTVGAHGAGTIGVTGLVQSSDAAGPIFLVPSATSSTAAAFLLEQWQLGHLDLSAGARQEVRSLRSDSNTALAMSAHTRAWDATTATIGAVLHTNSPLDLVANVGRGWRAPNLFDLFSNGLNRGDNRYEIGDPNLDAEYATSVEAGVRFTRARVQASVTGYQSTIDHYLYVTPTSEVRGGLPVFRHVQRDARLVGGEAEVRVQLAPRVSVHGTYDQVQGTDRATDQPLPLMPAPRAQGGVEWRGGGARDLVLGADVEHHATPTRLASVDYATEGYTLLHLHGGLVRSLRGHPVRIEAVVRNALNTQYKDFLSRYKTFAYAPGANLMLRVSTLTF